MVTFRNRSLLLHESFTLSFMLILLIQAVIVTSMGYMESLEVANQENETQNNIPCTSSGWPQLELFLCVHLAHKSKRNDEFLKFFMRSLFMFWPLTTSNTTLRIIFDEEQQTTPQFHEANSSIHTLLHQLREIEYSIQPSFLNLTMGARAPYYNDRGYDRQQWMMFWADNFTTSEYVGFVDADTLFISYVDREDLFEDGKPVVNGRVGVNKRPPWSDVPATTLAFTGLEEPMRCMSYFPVIIKTSHLKEIRDFISLQHVRLITSETTFESTYILSL